VFEHVVLLTPGPTPNKIKFRFCTPTVKPMNGLPGGVTGRFAIVPVVPANKTQKLVTTVVPVIVWMQLPASRCSARHDREPPAG
jgi:hypothetical protein